MGSENKPKLMIVAIFGRKKDSRLNWQYYLIWGFMPRLIAYWYHREACSFVKGNGEAVDLGEKGGVKD